MKPKRIQRKRTKGWRMPSNTLYVGRPGKWGNPFVFIGDMIYCDASHRRTVMSPFVLFDHENVYLKRGGLKKVVELYDRWINKTLPKKNYFNSEIVKPVSFTVDDIRKELKGKDLACWCSLNKPCHADVLLEIANS